MDPALEYAINMALPVFNRIWNEKSSVGRVELPMTNLGFSISEARLEEFVTAMEAAMRVSQMISSIKFQRADLAHGIEAAFIIS